VVHLRNAPANRESGITLEPQNSPLACLAMVRSRRLESLASATPALPAPCAILFQLLKVGGHPVFGYPARVYSACAVITYPDAQSEDVQAPELLRP
jgi:hypothetical protein